LEGEKGRLASVLSFHSVRKSITLPPPTDKIASVLNVN
jgi:hypothetical protein